ncbi:MAG: hypothetical protein OHK0039_05400 [Bacteroidia bacterium]
MKKARLFAILSTLLLMAQMGVGQHTIAPIDPSIGTYQFQVNTSLVTPPLAGMGSSVALPFFHYFYEFGDGYYASTGAEGVAHQYFENVSGLTKTQVRMHPIYSTSGQPPVLRNSHTIPPHSGSGPSPMLPGTDVAKIVSSWMVNTIRRGDSITIVLIYKNKPSASGQFSDQGKISLLYNTNTLTADMPVKARLYHNEKNIAAAAILGSKTKYNASVTWSYDLLYGEERAIYIDAKVKETALAKFPNLNLAVQLESSSSGTVLDEISLELAGSNDPNFITLTPDSIVRMAAPQMLKCRIDFTNIGNGPATDIGIKTTIHPGLDASTVSIISTYPVGAFQVQPTYAIDASALQFSFIGANLPGLSMPGLLDPAAASGYVEFWIQTDPDKYGSDDVLTAQAAIKFDSNAEVVTNEATVQLISPQTGDCPTTDDYTLWIVLGILFFLLLIFIAWLIAQNQTS